MTTTIFATAGSKLWIGPAKPLLDVDYVLSDFESSPPLTFVQVGMVENLGTFGDASAIVEFQAIERDRDLAVKGTRNAGTMAIVLGIKEDDAGQLALDAAEKTEFTYAFKIQFPNKSSASGAAGGIRYFSALVVGVPEELSTANNVGKKNVGLRIVSNIVKKVAT